MHEIALPPSLRRRNWAAFALALRAQVCGLLLVSGLLACQGSRAGVSGEKPLGERTSNALVAARPYESACRPTTMRRAAPLVVLCTALAPTASPEPVLWPGRHPRSRGFLYAYPDGTTNSAGKQFWNATELCCDFEGTGVDDVAYIAAVISRT